MGGLKPHAGDTRLVLAFDIGTIYSDISYCIFQRGEVPKIHGVGGFPGHVHIDGYGKVPSLLYYDKSGNVRAAGAEVLTESVIKAALSEGWTKVERWKLHFLPKRLISSIHGNDDLPPLPLGKSAVDVLGDFIKYLFQCAKTYIVEHHPDFSFSFVEDSIEYIFTYPNDREGVRQHLYREAIERADLIPCTPEGQSRVHVLSEGEAILHFFVANHVDEKRIDQFIPQGVFIIDAGRHTIEMSMFSVTANPISCKEIALPEYRLQGSFFVTRRARALLENKLEGWEHASPHEIEQFMDFFDHVTRPAIKSDREPAYIMVAGRRINIPKYNILSGKLKLTGEEATGLFNESIKAIIDAFEEQQKYTKIPITMAFFSGELSRSGWVWSRLQSYFEAKNITIYRPGNHIHKAVADGSVLSYIDRRVAERVARATYGVVCSVPVDANNKEHIYRRKGWERDVRGGWYVPGHFEVKIYKGDQVPNELEFRGSYSLMELSPAGFGIQNIRLVCYRGSLSRPEWVDRDPLSFSTLCVIHVDLSKAAEDLVQKTKASGKAYYQLDYDVVVSFGLTKVEAQLRWETKDGERLVPATVSFIYGTSM